MMITILSLSALAEPPRGEVLAGWSGTPAQNYSYVTAQPALVRSDAASLLARATVSHLHLTWLDGADVARVEAPGLSVGPAVVFTPGELALVLGVAVSARHANTRVGDTVREGQLSLDTMVSAEAFWRPGQRASLYTQTSVGLAEGSVWARAGGTYPVVSGPVSLWLGLESTSSGPFPDLRTEVGPVAEVPIRALRASFAVRAATPVQDLAAGDFVLKHTTLGVAAYWSY